MEGTLGFRPQRIARGLSNEAASVRLDLIDS
jgi:hypothetical protein